MYVNGWNVGLLRPRLWPFIIWRIVRPTWRLLSSIWMPPFSVVVCYFLHSLSCWCWSCFCCLALASVNGGITTNNGTFTLNTRTRHETYIELTKQNRTIPTFVCWVYNDRMSIEQWGYSLSSLSILECVDGQLSLSKHHNGRMNTRSELHHPSLSFTHSCIHNCVPSYNCLCHVRLPHIGH